MFKRSVSVWRSQSSPMKRTVKIAMRTRIKFSSMVFHISITNVEKGTGVFVGTNDVFDEEKNIGRRRLNFQRTIVKHTLEKSFLRAGYILNLGDVGFRNLSMEKIDLFVRDNAFFGRNNDVEFFVEPLHVGVGHDEQKVEHEKKKDG